MLLSIILDVVLLFAIVGGVLFGLRRGFVRTIVSTLMLFLATIFSALLYTPVINVFTSNLGNPSSARTGGSVVFFFLLVVFYAVLEYAIQRNYPNLRIRALRSADNILGAIVGIAWAGLGISLLLLIADFSAQSVGGQASFVHDMLVGSALTPLFREFFKAPLAAIRLLFPNGLPEILRFFTT